MTDFARLLIPRGSAIEENEQEHTHCFSLGQMSFPEAEGDLTTNLTGGSAESPDRDSVASTATGQSCLSSRRLSQGQHLKTPKRKVAEAALASRFKPSLQEQQGAGVNPIVKRLKRASKGQPLEVPACGCDCSCHKGREDSSANASTSRWCDFAVTLPHTNWRSVIDSTDSLPAVTHGGARFTLEEGVRIIIVERESQLQPALHEMRESMLDPVLAIDLEWRPDVRIGKTRNKVALVQLATSSVAVLIRTCRFRHNKLAIALEELLRDPKHAIVGYSWDGADEEKCQFTFSFGRTAMPRFMDLQLVSLMLGYSGFGLASLAKQVLGLDMRKARSIATSDWAALHLTDAQVLYAALDALIAGEVFRALRLWHSSPSECYACKLPLGAIPAAPVLRCKDPRCRKRFASANSLLCHSGMKAHDCELSRCLSCGRTA